MANYLEYLVGKYNSIQGIWITDIDGAIIAKELKEKSNDETNDKIKNSICFLFNSAIDNLTKIEKLKTKSIISVFDSFTLIQSKLSDNNCLHIICDANGFNSNLINQVIETIKQAINEQEKDLTSIYNPAILNESKDN